jgi:cytochrome c biogenesis protein CcmG/thiol:disulfide interchange protein DsbE
MKRWVALLPLAVLGLLAALFAGYGLRHDPKVMPAALVGKPLPDLVLPPLSGGAPERVRAQLSGPIFVNVFASWCVPCAVEAPALAAMKGQGARIVGVAYKDEPAKTKAFLARLGDPFAARLIDQDGRAGVDFGATGVPETYLVGADGRILGKHAGPLTPAIAEELLSKAR